MFYWTYLLSGLTYLFCAGLTYLFCSTGLIYYLLDLFIIMLFCFRTIIVPASAFDTKQRFLDVLREKCGAGTFNFCKGVTADDLADFCSFLKEDFRRYGNQQTRRCRFASHVGFQRDKYWILSKQVKFYINIQ